MVFLDSNVPMYLVGAPHPNKVMAAAILQRLTLQAETMVTDAEVFQEILHRYTAIQRPQAIQPAFDSLQAVISEVFPIDLQAVEDAKSMLLAYPSLSARDAIHVSVMKTQGVTEIVSFDAGFDAIPNLVRISS